MGYSRQYQIVTSRIVTWCVAVLAMYGATLQAQEKAATWQVEMPDKVDMYNFIGAGKFLLTQNWNRVSLHNIATGKKEWETSVSDFEAKGIRQVIDDRYLLRVRDGVACIDGMSGKRLWTAKLKGIDQTSFLDAKAVGTQSVMLTYKSNGLFGSNPLITTVYLDSRNGTEIYRSVRNGDKQTIQDSLGNLVTGTFTGASNQTIELVGLKKSLRCFVDGKISLYDSQTGEELLTMKESYPIIEKLAITGGARNIVELQKDPPNINRATITSVQGDIRGRLQGYKSYLSNIGSKLDPYSVEISSQGWNKNSDANYYYVSPDERFVVIILDHSVSLIDATTNKELLRQKVEPSDDSIRTIATKTGCIVKGSKELTVINFAQAKATNLPFENVGEIYSMQPLTADGKDYFLMSFSPKAGFLGAVSSYFSSIACVNLTDGKMQWMSAKDDKELDGLVTHIVKFDGKQLIIAAEQRLMIGLASFVDVFVQSLDVQTGKTIYRTRVARRRMIGSPGSIGMGQMPGVSNAANINFNVTLPDAQGALGSMNYSVRDNGDGKIFGIVHGGGPLDDPINDKSGGDGIFMLDASTGKFVYSDYSELTATNPETLRRFSVNPPFLDRNRLLMPGLGKMVLFDITTGKRLWTIGEPDLPKYCYPEFIHIIDDVIYVKYGKLGYVPYIEPSQALFDAPKMKTKEFYNWWPFGFLAIDAKTGKVLWTHESKSRLFGGAEDPTLFIPGFNLKDYYNPEKKLLYFVNYTTLYALQMRPDGGKIEWQIPLDENQVGGLYPDKMYALREDRLDKYILTTTIGGNRYQVVSVSPEELAAAHRRLDEAVASEVYIHPIFNDKRLVTAVPCLKANYNGKDILIYGEKGLAVVNTASGKVQWKQPWNYYPLGVQYVPSVIGKNLLYCVDNDFTCLDVETGAVKWKAKEWNKPQFILSPDESTILTVQDRTVRSYPLR